MPEDDKPMRITEIVLRPHIVIAGEADEERVRRFVERAHEACFIANSLKTNITIEPEITFRDR
jgi:organic hydroperoxide reductase OsmC/OhrA